MRLLLLALLLAPALQEEESGKTNCRPLLINGAKGEMRDLLRRYESGDESFQWKLVPGKAKKKYKRYLLSYPSPVATDIRENNTVHAKYWLPVNDDKKHPAVVVLHWLGGSFAALDLVCRKLAEEGVAALMIYMPHYGPRRSKDKEKQTEMITPDEKATLANFRQAVLDIRRAGDWLASRPEIESNRIGLMGISLGSIVGCLVAGVDPRFNRIALLIGGGDLPTIAMNESRETREIREKIRERGYSIDDLRRMWKPIEPLTFASRIRADRTLMINADTDEVIPKASTLKLQKAIGVREVEWFKGSHKSIVFQIGKIVPRVAEHLKQRTTYP